MAKNLDVDMDICDTWLSATALLTDGILHARNRTAVAMVVDELRGKMIERSDRILVQSFNNKDE